MCGASITTTHEVAACLKTDSNRAWLQDVIYLLTCLLYLELNPVRAGMVSDPGDYRWSSYAAHGFGNNISMLTPHRLYLSLGETKLARLKNYRKLIGESLGADVIAKIRHCTNKGLILGTEKFKQQFEEITGDAPTPIDE